MSAIDCSEGVGSVYPHAHAWRFSVDAGLLTANVDTRQAGETRREPLPVVAAH